MNAVALFGQWDVWFTGAGLMVGFLAWRGHVVRRDGLERIKTEGFKPKVTPSDVVGNPMHHRDYDNCRPRKKAYWEKDDYPYCG